jgi:hypothetical protein
MRPSTSPSACTVAPVRFVIACLAAVATLPALSGCHEHVAPPTELPPDAPHVALRGDTIFLDGKPAGSAAAILAPGRVGRADDLFAQMEALRDVWKIAHANSTFPGECVLEVERGANLLAVKSVFQTAALAGYPHETILVDGALPSRWVAHLEAITTPALTPPASLAVTLRADGVALSWERVGSGERDEQVVANASVVRDAVTAMMSHASAHTSPSDRTLDEAVVYAPNDTDVATLVPVLKALDGVRRDIDGDDGKRHSEPALRVDWSIFETLEGATTIDAVANSPPAAPADFATVTKRVGRRTPLSSASSRQNS